MSHQRASAGFAFPDSDVELGALICQIPRQPLLVYASLALAAGILVLSVVLFVRAVPGEVQLVGGAWLCFFVGSALGAVAWFDFRRIGLAVYERGVRTPSARLRWQDCEHVLYTERAAQRPAEAPGRKRSLRLEGAGRVVRLRGGGARTERLCTAILSRVVPDLVGRRMRELEAGQPFAVGRLTLTRAGLLSRQIFVPLAEIVRIDVEHGIVRVWRRGQTEPTFRLRARRRDVPILLGLLDRLRVPGSEKTA